jgi:hypothetical protein
VLFSNPQKEIPDNYLYSVKELKSWEERKAEVPGVAFDVQWDESEGT